MAAMEVALDSACARLPHGGEHNLRKRVAQSIIRCAKTGNAGVDALTEAGKGALARVPRGSSIEAKSTEIGPNWQSAA